MEGFKVPGDRILLEPIEEKKSNFEFEVGNREEPQAAKLIAMGPGSPYYKMRYEVGDTVYFAKGAGTPVKFEGKKYTIIREGDTFFAL